MSFPTKILMSWDVKPGAEAEYSEFVVNEFIPRLNRLGIHNLEFWFTGFGEYEQILVTGITDTRQQMGHIVSSEEWENLINRLSELVINYSRKLIRATGRFQL